MKDLPMVALGSRYAGLPGFEWAPDKEGFRVQGFRPMGAKFRLNIHANCLGLTLGATPDGYWGHDTIRACLNRDIEGIEPYSMSWSSGGHYATDKGRGDDVPVACDLERAGNHAATVYWLSAELQELKRLRDIATDEEKD